MLPSHATLLHGPACHAGHSLPLSHDCVGAGITSVHSEAFTMACMSACTRRWQKTMRTCTPTPHDAVHSSHKPTYQL